VIPIVYAPTASGKSELVLALAQELPVEIVSMDSMQVYRKMDIGTAKPSQAERQAVPHWMIDLVEPDEPFNAYLFRQQCLPLLDDIQRREKIPLLVGGTGLYLDTLRYGIFDGFSKNESIRRYLRKHEENDPGSLRTMLEETDPQSARAIHPNDLKRTIRALEVFLSSGVPFSQAKQKRIPDSRFSLLVLQRDRQDLYDRINQRVELMLEKGLVDETRALLERGFSPDLPAFKAIGYAESIAWINGKWEDEKQFVHVLKRNTRHFARRQMIWARRYEDARVVELQNSAFSANLRNLKKSVVEVVNMI